jgi:hypothetical protein
MVLILIVCCTRRALREKGVYLPAESRLHELDSILVLWLLVVLRGAELAALRIEAVTALVGVLAACRACVALLCSHLYPCVMIINA